MSGKLLYKRAEVCEITAVQPHELRAWEGEFLLNPMRSATGHRLYRQSDVDLILKIKSMIQEQGLTIAGVRKRIEAEGAAANREAAVSDPIVALLVEVRDELKDLLTLLSGDGKSSNVGT